MIFEELINAILNVAVFLVIPFIWWLLFHRKSSNFFRWLGIKKPLVANKKRFILFFILAILFFTMMSFVVDLFIPNTVQLASQRFAGLKTEAIVPALIFSFIKTGFAEELFFRGFLGKALSRKFSFVIGNLIQALIFGYLHGAMLVSIVGIIPAVAVFLFTATIGWLCGYLNEHYAEGSILPSWLFHGTANFIAALFDMFNIG
ncbi:hypothetical protein BAU15_10180 [Enterococcus sp. JM4C]|uniref:CPBP family intramembrane glutamic endopeptidase n=1 Tax=Candidatus Enterococcus huntleyi TaxID=1857217 RepID=UPI00137A7A58|nr:CPBP family intramembrane glutamic endopeptidase [Enterococcus sp. JM4C]KAF1296147.1 hypothetical protein BAU15_10180 [Enterococcus sp. JM4C]